MLYEDTSRFAVDTGYFWKLMIPKIIENDKSQIVIEKTWSWKYSEKEQTM